MNYNPFYYKWDFAKRKNIYFLISGIFLTIGIISILIRGLNLGVDFTSGTRVEVLIGQAYNDQDVLQISRDVGLEPSSIRSAGEGATNSAVLRFQGTISKEKYEDLGKAFIAKYGDKVTLSESSVSPEVGKELAKKALYAVLIAWVGIILYVTFRFEYRFAITAVLGLVHDVLIVIGFFALFQIEVDLTFIVALLTIVGYSINDTIVIYDRIRENQKRAKIKRIEDLEDLVNVSIRQTFLRSINTVVTVLIASVALLILGGEGIRNFALALTVGLFFGMYSSIFISAQMWVLWKEFEFKRKKAKPELQS